MMGTDVGKAKGVTMRSIVPVESIVSRILVFREEKVLIDRDLAERYEVSTKVLNQAVKRNMRRFPRDFMFQLMKNEKNELVTNCDRFKTLKHSSVLPKAFTEQGVAMLSSVLNSDRAVEVNIAIMKAFVHLRRMVSSHADLARRITELEERMEDHDERIKAIFEAMRQLMTPPDRPKKKIGFEVKEPKAMYRKRRG
jgi:hypothetical protein